MNLDEQVVHTGHHLLSKINTILQDTQGQKAQETSMPIFRGQQYNPVAFAATDKHQELT